MIRDCPKRDALYRLARGDDDRRQRIQGQAYAITREEAQNSPAVIEGTLPISCGIAHVLIDCRSTHSFVSPKYVQFLSVNPESLSFELVVKTPSGVLKSQLVYRACDVLIGNMRLGANLILLGMVDFDVILGVDWLSTHRALVDCYAKTVEFSIPGQQGLRFVGEKRNLTSAIISCVQATNLLEHGCECYLAYVFEAKDGPLDLKGVRVVEDIVDVFPKELPGLPPNREIEFTIELVPGTAPISQPLYRMAPAELVELKRKLQ